MQPSQSIAAHGRTGDRNTLPFTAPNFLKSEGLRSVSLQTKGKGSRTFGEPPLVELIEGVLALEEVGEENAAVVPTRVVV